MRDSVLRWEQDGCLHCQTHRKNLHLPNSLVGSEGSPLNRQDTYPPADPRKVAKEFVTGLHSLATAPLALSKAGNLRPGFLKLSVGLDGEQVEPIIHNAAPEEAN